MVELSSRTLAHIRALFPSSEVELAERILTMDCGDALPLLTPADAHLVERVTLAALRLSGGRIDELTKAVQVARADWRDLLILAGFADDPDAHLQWVPRRFDHHVVNRWLAGERFPGVVCSPNQPVLVHSSDGPAQPGSVISLESLEPEPRYLVELGSGEEIVVHQQHLSAIE